MKITLNKEIQLQSSIVYMKIEVDEKRDDIKKYLLGDMHFSKAVAERVNKYLKDVGVLNTNGERTEIGERVASTGVFPTKEEGKYQIWYSTRDELYPNQVFYFERKQPNNQSNPQSRSFSELRGNSSNHLLLAEKEGDVCSFKILQCQLSEDPMFDGNVHLTCIIEIDEQAKSRYKIHINGKDKDKTLRGVKDVELSVDDVFVAIYGSRWNKERLAVSYADVKDDPEAKKSFIIKWHSESTKWKGFSIVVKDLPVRPVDETEARIWRDALLLDKLHTSYVSLSEFIDEANMIVGNAAFKELNVPDVDRSAFAQSNLKERNEAYWHFHAPSDLSPNE